MSAIPAEAVVRREPALERVLRDFEALAANLPESVLPLAARRRAASELARLGWPQSRDEQWRYANLRALERIGSFKPARPQAGVMQPSRDAIAGQVALPPALAGFERWLFLDGVRAADAGTAGIAGRHGEMLVPRTPVASVWPAEQRLGLLSEMFAQDSAVLRIDGQAAVEILFVTTAAASGAAVYPRLHIELGAGARLSLIERHMGDTASPTLVSVAVSAELAQGAQLTHYRMQQCGAHVLFDDSLQATLHADARYEVRQIGIGAQAARTSAAIRLAGRAAGVGWQALAIGQGEQVHDTLLTVEHAAPATRTEEIFRGIADARARVAFSGHIHIGSGAPGAQARQSLRGLLESASAEVDLRPRLQIDVDEVTAQHGATTGRLDENLLFYLLSRGLDAQQARALLKWAFLGDVLRGIELPELRAQAERAAAGQLTDVAALAELADERVGA